MNRTYNQLYTYAVNELGYDTEDADEYACQQLNNPFAGIPSIHEDALANNPQPVEPWQEDTLF